MAHVLDDPLPEVLYTPDLAAIVRYSRASTLMQPITEASWKDLKTHFDDKQFIDIMFVVGMDQVISRFHAAIQTEVDGVTLDELALPGPVAGGPRAVSRGPGRHSAPPVRRQLNPPAWPHPMETSPANPTTTSAVRGEASVAWWGRLQVLRDAQHGRHGVHLLVGGNADDLAEPAAQDGLDGQDRGQPRLPIPTLSRPPGSRSTTWRPSTTGCSASLMLEPEMISRIRL